MLSVLNDRGFDLLTFWVLHLVHVVVPLLAHVAGLSGGRPEICAYGFRNPFRCGFDKETDELYCGDVGHTLVESIDLVT